MRTSGSLADARQTHNKIANDYRYWPRRVPMEHRRCKKCGETRRLTEFRFNGSLLRRRHTCYRCEKEAEKGRQKVKYRDYHKPGTGENLVKGLTARGRFVYERTTELLCEHNATGETASPELLDWITRQIRHEWAHKTGELISAPERTNG